MSNICNGAASGYEMPREPRFYENSSKLQQANCRIPMPKTKESGNKICENCDKEDVCRYKDECMKAVKDISDIEGRTNVFIKTHIVCEKWGKKQSMNDVLYTR